MKDIVPRWEWRTFGEQLGQSDSRFAALVPNSVQESDETYFLSLANNENVKVRDGLMDIKQLEQVNADGLEQWRPVMKASFPLQAPDAQKVFEALGVTPPPLTRASYTLEEIVRMLTETGRVQAVNIHKTRARYIIDGCFAEATEVLVGPRKTGTIAVELEDPARVIAAVRKLGFDGCENISYPRGLKQLLGMAQGASTCSDTR